MKKFIECSAVCLLLLLSACGEKKDKYLAEFGHLVDQAQFHPEAKEESDWKDIVEDRTEFLRKEFVEVRADLTPSELARIDSLDAVLKATVLRYSKSQKIFEQLMKE